MVEKAQIIPDKDTKLLFSVAAVPGNFGALLYNTAFRELKINAIYKPIKCEKNQFANVYHAMLSIGAYALSVSMPFKRDAFHLSEVVEEHAKQTGSVNSIKFSPTYRKGFGTNTDYIGFLNSTKKELQDNKIKNVLIYGNGCVAKTIKQALFHMNIASDFAKRNDEYFLRNKDKKYDGLINATPIGMDDVDDDLYDKSFVKNYRFVFDVVVKKETNLIKIAKDLAIPHVNGVSMSLEQLCEQFEYYCSMKPPRELFETTLKKNGLI